MFSTANDNGGNRRAAVLVTVNGIRMAATANAVMT